MEDSLFLKIVGALLLANAVYASFAHRRGKLTIYADWTDAAITGLTPLIALAIYYGLTFFQIPEESAKLVGTLCLLALVGFGIRMSWRANSSVLAFLSATIAKFTVLFSFYVLLWAVLTSSDRRRKYERHATVAKRNAAAVAATVSAYVAWSAWVCRTPAFTPIGLWFSGGGVQSLSNDENTVVENPEQPSQIEQAEQSTQEAATPQTFQVVFKGVQPNIPVSEARVKLAALFKGSLEQIDRLLAMPGHVIKRDIAHDIASKYKAAIESAGGVCELIPQGASAVSIDTDLPSSGVAPVGISKDPENQVASVSEGKWHEIFRLIETAGGPKMPKIKALPFGQRRKVVFNAWAFLFGPFYYLAKGMWKKGVVLFALSVAAIVIMELILDAIGMSRSNVSRFIAPAVFGTRANIDYYKQIVLGDKGWW